MKMNKSETITFSVTGGIAALCMLALPIWILGVPGVQGDYSDGWSDGLSAIFPFPFIWAGLFVLWLLVKENDIRYAIRVILLILCAKTLVEVILAFRLMI
ncbi:MAG: hypothetical protein ABFR33_04010 [Verrucomicrobiota bacterium]